jgi:hypothetical protein
MRGGKFLVHLRGSGVFYCPQYPGESHGCDLLNTFQFQFHRRKILSYGILYNDFHLCMHDSGGDVVLQC